MKLFVGSLSYDCSEEELKELFEQFGTVNSARIIMDRETGRSRGFGFVEMGSSEEGEAAMAALDGTSVHGRTIVVNAAKENDRRRSGVR